MTLDSETAVLRARVATLEALLTEHERAAAERVQRMEQLIADLSARTQVFEATLQSIVDGVVVSDTAGRITHVNEAATSIMGLGRPGVDAAENWEERYGFFYADGVTPYPREEIPLHRAVRGEPVDHAEMLVRSAQTPEGMILETSARTIHDARGERLGAVVVFRDITDRKRREREMAQQLVAERERNETLERLRIAVHELSTPILEVWDGVLALPLIGVVDSKRSAQVMETLLESVVRMKGRYVILDVTGVDVLDTATADHLLKIVRAVELLGTRCVLSGVRPSVAQTLVELGVSFGKLVTLRNLKHGLKACMRWKEGDAERAGREAAPLTVSPPGMR
ncbi:STAS domain-containing protein [Polyangium jinanense]|uniref:STAS domain-containing protein n=1 Tax=Polyangium jinanense TaxID=2829994 RepID=A0A9X3WXS6_9BACT|nr:STAS domain-containing protein [Polyangium jinanense]MDC3953714.1 STAS domain-containing protein [Polyangium jinanense]MDC3979165.1 STAS domain-containing protein [Polyangium jinanense]